MPLADDLQAVTYRTNRDLDGDILEYNGGVVNDIYIRRAGKKARYAVGEHVEIDDNYHLESWRLIKGIVADMTAAAITKLAAT